MKADPTTDQDAAINAPTLRSSAGRGETCLVIADGFVMETELGYARDACISDICDGQYAHATAVYCLTLADETLEDITGEIAQACLDHIIAGAWPGLVPYIPDLVEAHCGSALAEWAAELGGVSVG